MKPLFSIYIRAGNRYRGDGFSTPTIDNTVAAWHANYSHNFRRMKIEILNIAEQGAIEGIDSALASAPDEVQAILGDGFTDTSALTGGENASPWRITREEYAPNPTLTISKSDVILGRVVCKENGSKKFKGGALEHGEYLSGNIREHVFRKFTPWVIGRLIRTHLGGKP